MLRYLLFVTVVESYPLVVKIYSRLLPLNKEQALYHKIWFLLNFACGLATLLSNIFIVKIKTRIGSRQTRIQYTWQCIQNTNSTCFLNSTRWSVFKNLSLSKLEDAVLLAFEKNLKSSLSIYVPFSYWVI